MAAKRNRPSETSLKSLKALSHALLELDIQPTKVSPLVIRHPFTDSGIVGLLKEDGGIAIADLTSDPASLRTWREQMGRLIDDAEKPIDLFMMITKPYKLGFLKYAAPYLSKQDTALFLSQACTILDVRCTLPGITGFTECSDLADLIYDGQNLGILLDERGQGQPHFMEHFLAALELEGCDSLKGALDIANNLHCYDFVLTSGLADYGKTALRQTEGTILNDCMAILPNLSAMISPLRPVPRAPAAVAAVAAVAAAEAARPASPPSP